MSNGKKRGFTLIELLAVIIVIAVIALITVPIVTGYIESSRKKAFTNSVYHGMQSIDEELANQDFAKFPESGISAKNELVNIERNPFVDGKFLLRDNKVQATRVTDGRYCAKGAKEDLKVVLGECYLLDDTPPEIDAFLAGLVTSNSIQVSVNASDLDSDITSYEYSKDGGRTYTAKTMNTSYTFTNLTHNTSFNIVVRVTNQNKLSSTKSITLKTLLINTPTFTSNPALGTWSKSKVVTITYPGTKQSNFIYEYRKSSGAWTTVSGTSQNVTFTANGTLEARVRDGYNTVNASTLTITTIDASAPGVPTSVVRYDSASGTVRGNSSAWTNRTLWWGSFSASDTGGSGINRYEYSQNCTGSKSGNLSSSHTYSSNTNYTFCIRAVDNAGNIGSWSGGYYFRIDKTKPTCVTTGGGDTWNISSITLTGTCTDSNSGCMESSITKYFSGKNYNSYQTPGDVTDNAGNSITCPTRLVRVAWTSPTCTTTGGSSTWTNGDRTIYGICNDTNGSGCVGNSSKTITTTTFSAAPPSIQDKAGNSKSCSYTTVNVDKDSPYAPYLTKVESNQANTHILGWSCSKNDQNSTTDNTCTVNVKCDAGMGDYCTPIIYTVTSDKGSGVDYRLYSYSSNASGGDNCNWTKDCGLRAGAGSTYSVMKIKGVDKVGHQGPMITIHMNWSW